MTVLGFVGVVVAIAFFGILAKVLFFTKTPAPQPVRGGGDSPAAPGESDTVAPKTEDRAR